MDRKKWFVSLWTVESRDGAETSCSLLAVITGQGQENCSMWLQGLSGEHLEIFLLYLRVWTVDKVKNRQ